MGIFQTVYDKIQLLASDAWGFMIGILIIVALLGGTYYVLEGAAGMGFGGSKMTARSIIGIVGIVVLVLSAFLLLPALGDMLKSSAPVVPPWQ